MEYRIVERDDQWGDKEYYIESLVPKYGFFGRLVWRPFVLRGTAPESSILPKFNTLAEARGEVERYRRIDSPDRGRVVYQA